MAIRLRSRRGDEAKIVVDTTLDRVRDVAAWCRSGKEAILRDVKVIGEELIQGNVVVKSPGTFVDALRYITYHCRKFQD